MSICLTANRHTRGDAAAPKPEIAPRIAALLPDGSLSLEDKTPVVGAGFR